MTALVLAVCFGVALGWLVRSDMARGEALRWQAHCFRILAHVDRVAVSRDRWRAWAESRAGMRAGCGADGGLGDHAWLLGALEDACAELLPGEEAVAVTVQALAHGDGEPAVVLVAVADDGVPLRSVHFPEDDGGGVFEEIDLPAPGSPEWGAL